MTRKQEINYAIFVGVQLLISIIMFTRGIEAIAALAVALIPSLIMGIVIIVMTRRNSEFRLEKYPLYYIMAARVLLSVILLVIFSIIVPYYVVSIILGLVISVFVSYLDIYFFYHVPFEEWTELDGSFLSILRVVGHYLITLGFYFIIIMVYYALFGLI